MEYSIFCDNVREEIKDMLGECYNVRLEEVVKNNQVTYVALIINEPGRNITPSIYLEEYYEDYKNGHNIGDICLKIIVQYEKHKEGIKLEVSDIVDYNLIKDKLFVRAVNAELNEDNLNKMPHRKYYDLAMVVYAVVDDKEQCRASMNVTVNHLKMWNIDEETLFNEAINNTETKMKPVLKKMSEVMRELLADNDYYLENIFDDNDNKMYILTNDRKLDGAIYIMFDNVLEQVIDEIGSDVYVLPSSIHELILIPMDCGIELQEMKEMVKDINRTELDPKEILSDNVYIFKKGQGIIW